MISKLDEKTLINLTFSKLIALVLFVIGCTFTIGFAYSDFTRIAQATQKNSADIVDLKLLDAKVIALLEKQEECR